MNKNNKIFFTHIQTVRAIAALMVVVNHITSNKKYFSFFNFYAIEKLFANMGVMGLTLFFCVSGFLISFLLLNEKQLNGKIAIKQFYLRRILRIWPLYFLIIIIGQFIFPFIGGLNSNYLGGNITNAFILKTILYLLFLPNYVYFLLKPHNPFLDVTWSIGVEEQFYLFWPLCINKIKNLFLFCLLLLALQLSVEIATVQLEPIKNSSTTLFYFNKAIRLVEWTRVGYFAIGSMAAIIFVQKWHITNTFIATLIKYSPFYFAIFFALLLFVQFVGNFILLALAFAPFLIWLTTQEKVKQNWLSNIFLWLGNISYGIYLWHSTVIVFVINFLCTYNKTASASWLIYFLVIPITILIAHVSFKYFESSFLTLKKKYNL